MIFLRFFFLLVLLLGMSSLHGSQTESKTLNPPYFRYEVVLQDGRRMNGFTKKILPFKAKTLTGREITVEIPEPPVWPWWANEDYLPEWSTWIKKDHEKGLVVMRTFQDTLNFSQIGEITLTEDSPKITGEEIKEIKFYYTYSPAQLATRKTKPKK